MYKKSTKYKKVQSTKFFFWKNFQEKTKKIFNIFFLFCRVYIYIHCSETVLWTKTIFNILNTSLYLILFRRSTLDKISQRTFRYTKSRRTRLPSSLNKRQIGLYNTSINTNTHNKEYRYTRYSARNLKVFVTFRLILVYGQRTSCQ